MAKHEFQTEINQLLQLMIHSLYSNKEIFVRELVSNASDALDKLKFLTLTDENYKNITFDPRVDLILNEDEKTLTIKDTGIGMSEEELGLHLGTIAKSGTKSFLENMSGDNKKDSQLIGQFGVGFYASFMVANKVEVTSRKAGEEKAYMWSSDGDGTYDITEANADTHGTSIKLYLKDEEIEFAKEHTIETIISKYSNHIPFAIYLAKQVAIEPTEEEKKEQEENKDKEDKKEIETKYETKIEQINKASALWTIDKKIIKEDEYKDFYKTLSHDSEDPLAWIHTKAEGKQEYTTLFYIPSKAPMDLFRVDYEPSVKLYVNRVFITDDEKELLPVYLRFIKGIIDSSDLPLNVSREILQDNVNLRRIKSASVKKILSELTKMAKKDKEKYASFYKEFGKVLKEGLYNDYENKNKILDLIRFKSTNDNNLSNLADYKEKMQEDQKEIYFILGENEQLLRNSPLLEKFKSKNYNVLILDEDIDGIVFPMVSEYKDIKIVNVTDAKFEGEDNKEDNEKLQKDNETLINDFKNILGEDVKDVKASARLTDSPAVIVADIDDPNFAMMQMMKQMGQGMDTPEPKPIFEINPDHDLVKKFTDSRDQNLKEDIAKTLFDQAKLFNGQTLEDQASFIKRMQNIMTKAL